MSNKSNTYVYPVIFNDFKLTLEENVLDTYMYNDTAQDSYTIVYGFNENSSILEGSKLVRLNQRFVDSEYLLDIQESDDCTKIAYVMKRPPYLEKLFNNFDESRYSKIDDSHKYIIINHLNRYYSYYPDVIKRVNSILFNDPTYRKELSEELGYDIPEEVELSSKIDVSLETYNLELLNNL